MSKQTNKRLSKEDRETLLNFARQNITCPTEEAALAVEEKTARKIVIAAVHAKYPPKDMKVLKTYGQAQHDKCIQFGARYDRDATFTFKLDDEAPLVPAHNGCHTREYDFTLDQKAALAKYQLAKQTLDKAKQTKYEAYHRLVIGSSNFNDIATVWPAVEVLRNKIIPQTSQQRALAVLSQETLAMIKADNAGAKVAP